MQGRSGHRRPGYTAVIEGEAKGLMSPPASWPVKPPCLLLALAGRGGRNRQSPVIGHDRTCRERALTAESDPGPTSSAQLDDARFHTRRPAWHRCKFNYGWACWGTVLSPPVFVRSETTSSSDLCRAPQ